MENWWMRNGRMDVLLHEGTMWECINVFSTHKE